MAFGEKVVRPDILTCWKDVAQYMGKGVRTVQRWEREFGLPIWRPFGVKTKSSIVAHTRELDDWIIQHWSDRTVTGNQIKAAEATDPVSADLSSRIRTSHHLREANHALVREISVVLSSLVQNCDQLIATQKTFAPPPAILENRIDGLKMNRLGE